MLLKAVLRLVRTQVEILIRPARYIVLKTTASQLKADIPQHRLRPFLPFMNKGIDFMGPFQVKGLGNQRVRIKVYCLVVV